jgi:hypothetical protein
MSKPVSTVCTLSSLKSLSGRQSRTSCGLASFGKKIANCSRFFRFAQFVLSVRRALRYSSILEMFGTTKRAACSKARRISARLTAWIVTFAGALSDVWLILILASVRMRCNSGVKSEPKLEGGAPLTRTVIGCLKRVKKGTSRPLSRRNGSSMKLVQDHCWNSPREKCVGPQMFSSVKMYY